MPRDGLPEPKRKTTSLTGLVRSRATTPRTQCGRFAKWIAKRSRSIEMGLNALSLAQPYPACQRITLGPRLPRSEHPRPVRSRPTARDEPAGCWSAPGGPLNPSRQSPVTWPAPSDPSISRVCRSRTETRNVGLPRQWSKRRALRVGKCRAKCSRQRVSTLAPLRAKGLWQLVGRESYRRAKAFSFQYSVTLGVGSSRPTRLR
jgi:hypothetical protein